MNLFLFHIFHQLFHQELLQLDAFRARAGQVNGLRARQHTEMADVSGNGRGMDPQAPVQEVRVQAGIQETSFPLGGGPASNSISRRAMSLF